ncbi:MAG TPA: hypothetical protein ENI52_05835 [Thermoplasmata archaeon]|nr:hypothetical protein [Thermoplasmata archaeon]
MLRKIKNNFILNATFRTIMLFSICYIVGMISFHYIEKASWIDSFYWIVITLSTVGYGDLTPSNPIMKIIVFPIVLIGIVVFGSVAGIIVEEQQARLRGLKKSKQKNHIVILGYNDASETAIEELIDKYEITLIDENIDINPRIGEIHFIKGNPKKEDVLLKANIEEARGVIIALKEDSEAILATLAVRNLTDAKIIVSISSMENIRRARSAGADVVVVVDALAGRFLASSVFEEFVVKFFEDVSTGREGYDIVEMPAREFSGKEVKDIILKHYEHGLLIAIVREEKLIIKPDLNMKLREDDKIICIVRTDIL